MAKLLHIEASPRKQRSASMAVARTLLEAYRTAHPDDEIETWDLWAEPLPEFDGAMLDAKYAVMHGEAHSAEQAAAWGEVTALFERFNAADKYVFSTPMWNFGIPYKLKHFLDVITQPGLAFSFSPDTGYTGLVDKPAAAVFARGGTYTEDAGTAAMDLQKGYLDLWFGFVGFQSVQSVLVEPTLGPPDVVSAARSAAEKKAEEIGRNL